MKLSVSTYSMWRWMNEHAEPIEAAVEKIAELGVTGVEFAGFAPDRADPSPIRTAAKMRKLTDKIGLEIAGYSVGAELLVPQDTQRHAVTKLMEHVDVARELGAKSMRHDVTRGFGEWSRGVDVPRTFDGAVKAVAPAIRELSDYGATRGVKTSLENHGFFMQAAQRVEKLIKTVKHPNFGLTLDMGNFLCVNDDPVKAVKRLGKYAINVHVKDFHVRPKDRMPPSGWFATPTRIALRGAIVGHGTIDVPAQFAHLKKIGYEGFVSLEFEGMEEPVTAIRLGLEYVKKLIA